MPDGHTSDVTSARRSSQWRRNVALVGIAITIVIGAAVYGTLYLADELDSADSPDALTGTAVVPSSAITGTAASASTPDEGEPAYPPGSLPAMLAMAPDRIDDDEGGLPVEAAWADLAAWFGIVGINQATASDAEVREAMAPLQLPGVLQARGLSDEWRDLYGFSVRDINQVLTIGDAPDQIVIMRGDFDPDALYDTWVRNGYQAVEVEETTVWSLFPGDRIDLTAPASRPALGLLNNVVVLDGRTLVASARLSGMAELLRVTNEDDPSLLVHGDLEAALTQWPQDGGPVSVVLADGAILRMPAPETVAAPDTSEGTVAATPLAVAPLPEVGLALFGVMPGPADPAATQMRILLMYDADPDALDLVAIVKERAASDSAWSQEYRLESVETGPSDAVVEVVISRSDSSGSWSQLIQDRNIVPLHWPGAG